MIPLVTISPGYNVPPVTRPRGCHVPTETEIVSHCFCKASVQFFGQLERFADILHRELSRVMEWRSHDHRTSPKSCKTHSVQDISSLES